MTPRKQKGQNGVSNFIIHMKKKIENISKIILQCIEENEGLKMIWNDMELIWNEDTLCFGIRTLKKSRLSLFCWSDRGGKERTQF